MPIVQTIDLASNSIIFFKRWRAVDDKFVGGHWPKFVLRFLTVMNPIITLLFSTVLLYAGESKFDG
jgi:hypothetical protein